MLPQRVKREEEGLPGTCSVDSSPWWPERAGDLRTMSRA